MNKSIPRGLLAVAVSSALLIAQEGNKPMTGGWSAKPGSGLKYDGGDAFGMTWTNLLQVHWSFTSNENAPDINNFTVRRARTTFAGHAFSRNIQYRITWDAIDAGAAGDGNLKDGWVQWNFASSDSGTIGLRVGQGKTLFGLESTGSASGLWFVERSSTSRTFADARSRGAWLNGLLADNRLRWSAGAMNGDAASGLGGAVGGTTPATGYTDRGEESNNSDNALSYVLTASFDPLGDFFDGKQTAESFKQGDWRTEDNALKATVGVGVALGNGRTATPVGGSVQDIQSTSLNLNTAWTVSRFHVLGEYFLRTDDQQGATPDKEKPKGWTVGAGYLLPQNGDSKVQWGLGLRFNRLENDIGNNAFVDFLTGMQGIGSTPGDANEITAVLNAFYHGHACKTQLEYTFQDVDPDGTGSSTTNHIFRIGFQLQF
ncbi:MAG: porin [Planctomycetota bacterium]